MAATNDSGTGHGTQGAPQGSIEEQTYPSKVSDNQANDSTPAPSYLPSPKHEPGSGWGTANPIKSQAEGQKLLDTGIHDGRQIYNITDSGKIVKFQPSTPPNIRSSSKKERKSSTKPSI